MPVIEFPKCYYCIQAGHPELAYVGEIFLCKRCGQHSHYNCLVEITPSDRCTHLSYSPIKSTGWNTEETI